MYEKIAVTFSGRNLTASTSEQTIDTTHQRWVEGLLEESPASLQNVSLAQLPDGELTMEWQAVFQGAGVAYLRLRGSTVAVALLLEGRFLSTEAAAIEAVQQTLIAGKTRGAGFDVVKKQHVRPLRAIIYLDEGLRPDLMNAVEYWMDCLAATCFRTIHPESGEARQALPGTGYSVPAV